MADYKGMLAELAELATEEQVMFTVSVITKSDEAFDKFMDARERLSKWIVEHAAVINEAITEKKYNDMLNEEVRQWQGRVRPRRSWLRSSRSRSRRRSS